MTGLRCHHGSRPNRLPTVYTFSFPRREAFSAVDRDTFRTASVVSQP